MQSLFTLFIAVGSGVYHSWKLGLLGACYVPLVFMGAWQQMKVFSSQDNVEKEALARSAKAGTCCVVVCMVMETMVAAVAAVAAHARLTFLFVVPGMLHTCFSL